MTICTILASMRRAKTANEVALLYHNAAAVYDFDPEAMADLVRTAHDETYRIMHPGNPSPPNAKFTERP
jgi:hypothetical protein